MKMKSYVWLQTADGSIQQVEEEIAILCPMICREYFEKGTGSSKNYAISLPQRVGPAVLGSILDYCRFHQVPGRSSKERKTFDEKFIRMDTRRLCELISASDSLQLRPLVDLTSRALARIIEGKMPEEIREIFHLPDDLTEEEKLEPLRNMTDDPHIRLLNRLYARKRQELKERQKLKSVQVEEEPVDERSVDDLVVFINGANEDPKGTRNCKHKKKSRRRKGHPKDTSTEKSIKNYEKQSDSLLSTRQNDELKSTLAASGVVSSKFQDTTFLQDFEFGGTDIDDELDPAMKEQLDREVADFARRLNSAWPQRIQELFNGNGSLRGSPGSLLLSSRGYLQ